MALNENQRANLQKAIEALNGEQPLGQGVMYNPKTDCYCIVGFLLHLKGMSNNELLYVCTPNSQQLDILNLEFGLFSDWVYNTMRANDKADKDQEVSAIRGHAMQHRLAALVGQQ